MNDASDSSVPANPYAAPETGLPQNTLDEGNTFTSLLAAFVGPKSDVYMEKWHSALHGHTQRASFNWAAFLFSGFWIPYRKMYKVTLVFYSAVVVTTMVEYVVFVFFFNEPETPTAVERISSLVFSLICGFGANRWYLNHAKQSIDSIQAMGLSREQTRVMVIQKGGTNFWAALGMFALFLGGIFVAVFLMVFVDAMMAAP